ncbi:MAG: ABC transporter ATP-binding protein [Deltaproteobacteria bacterium]|nr:ABC transporter ATP-binding protein [Deltaproteobacteria bacterium]
MRPIIKVENVSKRYWLGQRDHYHMLRDRIAACYKAPLRAAALGFRRAERRKLDLLSLWALQNVSLEVQPGEVLGIIGRNGAGKSTLLKILSQITEPTSGRIELYGRVGSLLEVGTGFHSELTGRENIFLSGAILGMRKAEIARKFDEIVAFAEIEQFIDTPVKHFSSGMYTRLAFAVAAHLEPEILLVDEILAVGDMAFQKKCLGKMGDVARRGRTVFFVSHNLPSVEALCSRCLLFSRGRLAGDGTVNEILLRYMTAELQPGGGACSLVVHAGRRNSLVSMMTAVALSGGNSDFSAAFKMGGRLTISVSFGSERAFTPVLSVTVKNMHGLAIIRANNQFIGGFNFGQRRDSGTITCTFDKLPLLPGRYAIDLSLGDGFRELDAVNDAITFEVLPADVFGTGKLPPPGSAVVFWPAHFAITDSDQARETRAAAEKEHELAED